jgi:hypothetical protein
MTFNCLDVITKVVTKHLLINYNSFIKQAIDSFEVRAVKDQGEAEVGGSGGFGAATERSSREIAI